MNQLISAGNIDVLSSIGNLHNTINDSNRTDKSLAFVSNVLTIVIYIVCFIILVLVIDITYTVNALKLRFRLMDNSNNTIKQEYVAPNTIKQEFVTPNVTYVAPTIKIEEIVDSQKKITESK
jgi:hypothetical protein